VFLQAAFRYSRPEKLRFTGFRGAPQMLVQARHFHRYSRKKIPPSNERRRVLSVLPLLFYTYLTICASWSILQYFPL